MYELSKEEIELIIKAFRDLSELLLVDQGVELEEDELALLTKLEQLIK